MTEDRIMLVTVLDIERIVKAAIGILKTIKIKDFYRKWESKVEILGYWRLRT